MRAQNAFQFYISTISTVEETEPGVLPSDFNSTLVRLARLQFVDFALGKRHFNSTLVRLARQQQCRYRR